MSQDLLRYVKMPVKPLVRKYLEAKYGAPLRITRKTNEGKMLISLFRSMQHDARFDKRMHVYTDELTMEVSVNKLHKRMRGRRFTSRAVFDFSDFVETQISDSFNAFADVLRSTGYRWTVNDIYTMFIQRYGLTPDDIAFETLKRGYNRYRDALNEVSVVEVKIVEKKSAVIVPPTLSYDEMRAAS